jgi:hypothetical protein
MLPREFELATAYAAAVASRAAAPGLAARFVALLGGAETRELRRAGGFELDGSGASAAGATPRG